MPGTYLLNRNLQLGGGEILKGRNTVINADGTVYTAITAMTPDTTTVFVNQFTELAPGSGNFGVVQAGGATTPTDGEAGFSFGCIFANPAQNLLYINAGNSVSCAFRPLQLGQSARSGAGAIPLTAGTCLLTTTGADALTLADGASIEQRITIIMVVDGGDGTLTPATPLGFATVTFDAVGSSVTLEWTGSAWAIVGQNAVTVA